MVGAGGADASAASLVSPLAGEARGGVGSGLDLSGAGEGRGGAETKREGAREGRGGDGAVPRAFRTFSAQKSRRGVVVVHARSRRHAGVAWVGAPLRFLFLRRPPPL